jgi:hypothetical protein
MASASPVIEEHDVVQFTAPIARWPAGTKGTVVSDHGPVKLVEISDSWGCALDFVDAPVELLKLKPRYRPDCTGCA